MVEIERTAAGSYVRPGTGWPQDPADATTPVAGTPGDVAELAAGAATLAELAARVSVCRACPRLVEWREQVAATRRAAFAEETYWGRPVPDFGDEAPRILFLGLAPAAHGANRTGRMFTGDRSGEVLYAALHRAGLASAQASVAVGDGLTLPGARLVAPVHCAPPANKPTPAERDACRPWLARELTLLRDSVRVVVALGAFAWQRYWSLAGELGEPVPRPKPAFGHGTEHRGETVTLLGCYHVSQQNTFTGRLTEAMLDAVLARARTLARL